MKSQPSTAAITAPSPEFTFPLGDELQKSNLGFSARWDEMIPATQTVRSEKGSEVMSPEPSAERPAPPFPLLRPDPHSFSAKQKWEGYVTEVGTETFWARLIPLIGEGGDQEAEVYLEEVDKADRSLIEPGAVFYWSIGYLDGPSGRVRSSYIRFRRMPAWAKRELEAANGRLTEWCDIFDAESAI